TIACPARSPTRTCRSIRSRRWRRDSCATSSASLTEPPHPAALTRTRSSGSRTVRHRIRRERTQEISGHAHPRVTFLACRQLDDAFARERFLAQRRRRVRYDRIVDAGATLLNEAPRLAVARRQAGALQQRVERNARRKFGARDDQGGQVRAERA